MTSDESKHRVLFVCLGNICRSPLARALFAEHVSAAGLSDRLLVDSAGTSGLHAGENADPRTLRNARQNGLDFAHKARQFTVRDFDAFDHIIVMDRSNKSNVEALASHPAHFEKVRLMREWDIHAPGEDVPDPWYGGESGFQEVYDILHRSTLELLREIQLRN